MRYVCVDLLRFYQDVGNACVFSLTDYHGNGLLSADGHHSKSLWLCEKNTLDEYFIAVIQESLTKGYVLGVGLLL